MENTAFKKEKLIIGDYSINQDDLFSIGDAEITDKGLVHHHISSANDLYTNGIPQIITQVFKVEKDIINQRDNTHEDKLIDRIFVSIKFTDVFISRPTTINYYSGKEEIIFPNVALLEDKTYSGNLRVNASITATATFKDGSTKVRTDEVTNYKLCRVPIMVDSILCNRHGCTPETRIRLNEDPSDPGGYFIINGIEWVIDCIENILFNQIRIFKNEGYSKEVMRVEFVSKPGDTYQNSTYVVIRLLSDKQLVCEILRNLLKGIQIPFYLLFRIFGWNSDKEMFDNIIYGYDDDISKNMINYIMECMNAKYSALSTGRYVYNQIDAVKIIVDELKYTDFKYLDLDNKPENYQLACNKIFVNLDTHFLPHIGLTPNDRPKKLRYLALIIRKVFLVKMGNIEPTDRDSYKSKRIHAAGTSYAKSFKTYFNASIIQQINRKLMKDFKSMSFSHVDLATSFKSSIYGADFERSIMQTITSGNKSQITVNKKARINRLSSQILDRKNQLAMISTLRQITTTSSDSAKQSERAHEMRRVHMSFLGYVCCIHSPSDDKAGINKQLALFASVLGATSSDVIKDILINDSLVSALDTITPSDIYEKSLHNIYVNGEWIGCTNDCLALVNKYRKLRRAFKINPLTTIYWDNTQDEALFWVDVGRVVRPLIIVYNNKRDPEMFPSDNYEKTKKFKQGIAVSQKILDGVATNEYDMEYLLKNNIVEYITPEEQENFYLCPFYNQLKVDSENELTEYTHCDIPQSMLGLTALTGPYANFNQTPRITFQTAQCRQTCGVFALNWPYRCDKDTFLQYICETPLVKTAVSKYIFPNGSNTVVAFMCYSGYNQEDSLVISQGAVDRGLFTGSKFTFYKTELDQREEFGNPDINDTSGIKSGTYSKLNNGIIAAGTKINKGDAIIGKYMKTPKTNDQEVSMVDRSVLYKEKEQAIVHNVIINRNESDERFCKVACRKIRPVVIGDKFSMKGTAEVLTDIGWIQIQHLDIHKHKVATINHDKSLAYVNPCNLSKYYYIGDMYNLENNNVKMCVTKNHKLYVRKTGYHKFELLKTDQVFGNSVQFKKNVINNTSHIELFTAYDTNGKYVIYNMHNWIYLISVYISTGLLLKKTDEYDESILITNKNETFTKLTIHYLILLNVEFDVSNDDIYISGVMYPEIYYELSKFDEVDGCQSMWPEYMWNFSQLQSQIIVNLIIESSKKYNEITPNTYYPKNKDVANYMSRLALHANWSGCIYMYSNKYIINIEKIKNEPIKRCNNLYKEDPLFQTEQYEKYEGYVYCLEVPDTHIHVYYSRDNEFSPPCWTGNSSRHGQKGVCGILLRDSDMPFTKDGIRPEIIVNPHAIPSRMTIGQLYESHTGNYCAMKGTHTDATIFKEVDIESMGAELEAIGMHRYGYHRLYSGITGEFIDCLIFMGPTYYQRLQKFVIDAVYSISQGPSDVLSRQPLDGKSSGGGLKIGEMERDVICSHGSTKFLQEKYFDHSDGFTEYICRCGKAAVVNIKKNIYKCKYCKDNADIAGVPTSWSSKLFMQEMETMSVGIRRHLTPFTYENVTTDEKS